MGLIDIASGNSVWRGLDYSKEKIEIEKTGNNKYDIFILSYLYACTYLKNF